MAERRLLRRIVACLPVLGLLGMCLLPAEHVHAREAAPGRSSAFVHRHFNPHPHDVDHDHARTAGDHHHPDPAQTNLDHNGHEAQRLEWWFTAPRVSQLHPDTQWVSAHVTALPSPALPERLASDVDAAAHDPPWARSYGLRAPPSRSV